jgi:hypothetical protein
MWQDRTAEVSAVEIAVHRLEGAYVHPPEKFIAQANLTDKGVFDRFSLDNFPDCFKEYADWKCGCGWLAHHALLRLRLRQLILALPICPWSPKNSERWIWVNFRWSLAASCRSYDGVKPGEIKFTGAMLADIYLGTPTRRTSTCPQMAQNAA